MENCKTSTNDVGKNLLAQWVQGCGDLDYANATYKSFGTINSKSLSFTSSTVDATNDQSGADTSTLVTRRDGEFTASGYATTNDSVASNQNELINYYHAEMKAGRQPCVWLKMAGKNYPRVYHIFAVITAYSEGASTDDLITFEMTFKPTDTGVADVSAVEVSAAP